MGFSEPMRRGVAPAALLAWACVLPALPLAAAPAESPPIYTCVDERGRTITSDRPIPDCLGKEQRVLGRDGSVKRVVPPSPTGDERAAADARELKAQQERVAATDAARRDRNLLQRYPDEAAHKRARDAALENARSAVRLSDARMADLAKERKALHEELEFYGKNKPPAKLKAQIEANDAAAAAQLTAVELQRGELSRLNRAYDIELERLKRLWAGAKPGSLGPIATVQEPAPAASSPARP